MDARILSRQQAQSQTVHHLIAIDAGLPDLDVLLRLLPVNCSVCLLLPQTDALTHLARTAAGLPLGSLASLHILGHGRPGRMHLGSAWVDARGVHAAVPAMRDIAAALADDAHIWLYGCNSAGDPDGVKWLDAWALATGASVHGTADTWSTRHPDLPRANTSRTTINPLQAHWQASGWTHALGWLNQTPVSQAYPGKSIGEARHNSAFAALRADGTVVTWGSAGEGGDSSLIAAQLTNVQQVFSNGYAFAALKANGTVVSWGWATAANTSGVASQLNNVKEIFSCDAAFAALKNDGTVVSWGMADFGGNSANVAAQLTSVQHVFSTGSAFAALKADGTVVTWGNLYLGGTSTGVAAQLVNVRSVSSTSEAFAALKADGTVVTWGDVDRGGSTLGVTGQLTDIQAIFSNSRAFAALKADGRIVTWGDIRYGGDTSRVAAQLTDVESVTSSSRAFAALKADGTVVTWGSDLDTPGAAPQLTNVQHVFSNSFAFAALRADGSVVSWGDAVYGGDSSSVAAQLTNVQQVFSNQYAFAALKVDGTVVTWGRADYGGDSSGVSAQLTEVRQVFSNGDAFAALKADGTVVTWGYAGHGGNSSGVVARLTEVVGINTVLTDDDWTTGSVIIDTIPPTVNSSTPADDATGVTLGSDIGVTFSEAIQRGTGNILLKTAAGTVVATYDAATSANLSISGSTLTINPTADLSAGTQYFVEFPSGSIKDLAGNSYAGTTTYDFTTTSAPVLSKDDNFVAAQYASPAILGSETGNDTYLLSSSLLPAGTSMTISDAVGTNSVQLAPGLAIASSRVGANALQLTLANGSVITLLGAAAFGYDAAANSSAGIDGTDLSYAAFVQQVLGVAVPTGSTLNTGGAVVIGGGTAQAAFPAGDKSDDFVVAQYASPAILGAGTGDDTYLLSPSLLPPAASMTISDAVGTNSLQLANGLDIASSLVAPGALQLTLVNGSVITVLGAAAFGFEAGGNRSAGIDGPDLSYAQFALQVLGVAVPASGIAVGGPVLIGATGPIGTITVPVGSMAPLSATSGADVFAFDVGAARATTANTQIDISAFATASDKLRLDLPLASGVGSLAALDGQQGVAVQFDPFASATVVDFGPDADGTIIAITLLGVTDAALVQVEVA